MRNTARSMAAAIATTVALSGSVVWAQPSGGGGGGGGGASAPSGPRQFDAALGPVLTPLPTARWDKAMADRAASMAQRAIGYLRSQQDEKTGGWSVPTKPGQPHLPAISGLVVTGMLMQPGVDASEKSVAAGLGYILKHVKPDGGIYDTMLPSYNTAICLSTLARAGTPEARAAIPGAQEFLKRLQWGSAQPAGMGAPGPHGTEAPAAVGPDHPFFGGLGYGNRGRPDISNLAFAVQAWRESGLPADDPAFQRAIVFLQRTQMLEQTAEGKPVNDRPWAKGSRQGGFIYATAEDDKTEPRGQSFAGSTEETLSDGTRASRLRAYGSATYLGFKSYIFAGLTASDPRVTAALDWLRANWSLDENPGLGSDGYWYYIAAMGRALEAHGSPTVRVVQEAPLRTSVYVHLGRQGRPDPDGVLSLMEKAGVKPEAVVPAHRGVARAGPGGRPPVCVAHFKDEASAAAALRALAGRGDVAAWQAPIAAKGAVDVDWRVAMVQSLAARQNADGSFRSIDDRWMENNPVLVTAYALLAIQHAARSGAATAAEINATPGAAAPAPAAPVAPAPKP